MKNQSTLASHRFPSVYLFMQSLEDSLRNDGYAVSLPSLGDIISTIFGYDDLSEMFKDANFCNDNFSEIEYVYYDEDVLVKRLGDIIDAINENSTADSSLTPDVIYEHIHMVFEKLPYELVSSDRLSEIARDSIDSGKFDILSEEGISGAIAESDTLYEEVTVEDIIEAYLDDGFHVTLQASSNGYHRKENDMPGRDLNIAISLCFPAVIGKYCLKDLEVTEVNGGLVDYWDEQDEFIDKHLSPRFDSMAKSEKPTFLSKP